MWTSFSPEELTRQYSCSQWVRRELNIDPVDLTMRINAEQTTKWRTTLPCERGISYGNTLEQTFDWFPAAQQQSQVKRCLVHIHGGYWQALSINHASLLANAITLAGVDFVALGYDLAPAFTIPEILRQVRQGLKAILARARERGITEVFLSGHSAGGHLAAMLLANQPRWENDNSNLEADDMDMLAGGILISGVYDLEPIVNVPSINAALGLTADVARELSPTSYLDAYKGGRLLVTVGGYDSPEYQRQSKELVDALHSRGHPDVSLFVLPEVDHFEMIDLFVEEHFELRRRVHEFLNK